MSLRLLRHFPDSRMRLSDTSFHPVSQPEGVTEGEELSILNALCVHDVLSSTSSFFLCNHHNFCLFIAVSNVLSLKLKHLHTVEGLQDGPSNWSGFVHLRREIPVSVARETLVHIDKT